MSPPPGGLGLGAPVIAALSLGLAPFVPEPHLVGKLRWVAGGARGMAPMDWMDLAFHAAPWVWLVLGLGAWAWRLRPAKGAPS